MGAVYCLGKLENIMVEWRNLSSRLELDIQYQMLWTESIENKTKIQRSSFSTF